MLRSLLAGCLTVVLLAGCGQALLTEQELASPAPDSPAASEVAAASVEAQVPAVSSAPVASAAEASAAPADAVPQASVEAPPAEAAPAPTIDPAFAGVQLPPPAERWRYMQMDREVFEPLRTYATSGPETLWWYDPLFGQTVALGEINGTCPVQAAFRLRGQESGALEVPYQINSSFGLRLPDALQVRMRNAGAGEWVETFVFAKSDVQLQQ